MIKLIIFDLDGVLVEARDIHYEAMNRALSAIDTKYCISREEHLAKYDGLSTKKKLSLLTKEKGLPENFYNDIWKNKQGYTQQVIRDTVKDTDEIHTTIKNDIARLSGLGYKIYCCSNSIKSSVRLMLSRAGYIEYFDEYFSNEDVNNPKPHPEIYMKAMVHASVKPKETLIIEDSHIGRKAAHESGAHVMGVKGLQDVYIKNIQDNIDKYTLKNTKKIHKPRWQGGEMKVLIPMAGAGSRFEKAGYTFPKPLIEINGKPMIQVVVENINVEAQHIFIVQKSHYEKYNLKYLLNLISPECEILQVDGVTEGAACTTLLAKEFIDNDQPLLTANSDQYVDWDSNEFLYSMQADGVDGGILTFDSVHPKWSFAKTDDNGYVTEVAEKRPISKSATVGIYYWDKGSDYVKYAERMIDTNDRVNNEFYVCPVFNHAIQDGKKIKTFDIEKGAMWGIGTPEDLKTFLEKHEEV